MLTRDLDAFSAMVLEDHGPGCGHDTRYRTVDGRYLCDICEARAREWRFCGVCMGYYPPDQCGRVCRNCDPDWFLDP